MGERQPLSLCSLFSTNLQATLADRVADDEQPSPIINGLETFFNTTRGMGFGS